MVIRSVSGAAPLPNRSTDSAERLQRPETRPENIALAIPIAAAVGVIGAVAQLCQGIAALFGSQQGNQQMNEAFQRAEAQITETIGNFNKIINACTALEELSGVDDQVERLLSSVGNPAVCQRIGLALRQAVCRKEQALIRENTQRVRDEKQAEINGLRLKAEETKAERRKALEQADGEWATRLSVLLRAREEEMRQIEEQARKRVGEATAMLQEFSRREHSLAEQQKQLEHMHGLAGELAMDSFSRRASSVSRVSDRRSNQGTILSKPRPKEAGK